MGKKRLTREKKGEETGNYDDRARERWNGRTCMIRTSNCSFTSASDTTHFSFSAISREIENVKNQEEV